MENKSFKISAIKMLMERNYKVPSDTIDLESNIDDSLSMAENWNNIKPKVLQLCVKPNRILYN